MIKEQPREVRFDGIHCDVLIQQFPCGVVVLKIAGSDVGEFGDAAMQALDNCLAGSAPVRFFIDARDVRGASIDVSGEWAKWLGSRKAQFLEVSMLTGSRFIQITADFVRRFAEMEGLMRIYTEAPAFDDALAEALGTSGAEGNGGPGPKIG
ncbi:MAG TPA: hypothetical protein VGH38_09580 [Bryobacteraceae bacterium]|jgi:hypothetical protein